MSIFFNRPACDMQEMRKMGEKVGKVTRFEVIDENGRIYTICGCEIELSWQDDGQTLKVFVKSAPERYKKK